MKKTKIFVKKSFFIVGFLSFFIIFLFFAYFLNSNFNDTKKLNKPNIIIISIDSLRADYLGVYGNEKNLTPFLDSLFERGIIFENAITPAPFTFQTDASLLTSLYPSQNGIYTWKTPLKEENINVLLQQALKEEGYDTAAFISPSFFNESKTMFAYFDNLYYNPNTKNLNESRLMVAEWASKRRENPSFIFWHIFDVHSEYKTPPKNFYSVEYNGIFSIENKSIPKSFESFFVKSKNDEIAEFVKSKRNVGMLWEGQTSRTIEYNFGKNNHTFTQEDIDYLRASYEYGVLSTDRELELFFKKMEKSGFLKNSIVIITAEHGEDLKEHGYFFHSDIYDVNTRVPLLFLYTGNTPVRISEPVSSLDIMPTILDLINKTIPEGIEGKSLIPLMEGEKLDRIIFSERPPFGEYSVRKGQWKYILRNSELKSQNNLEFIERIDSGRPGLRFFFKIASYDEKSMLGDELYDLSNDPYEQNNLVGKGYPMEKILKEEATSFRERMNQSKNLIGIGENIEKDLNFFCYP